MSMSRFQGVLALALTLLIGSCGDGGSGPTEPPPPSPLSLTGLQASPKLQNLQPGNKATFSVRGIWSDNLDHPLPPTTWTTTGLGTMSNNIFTADTIPGTSLVIVSAGGKSDTAKVTILALPPPTLNATVSVTASWLTVNVTGSVGGTAQGAVSHRIYFGDGLDTTISQASYVVTHTYQQGGTYVVLDSVERGGLTVTATAPPIVAEAVPPVDQRTTRNRPEEGLCSNKFQAIYVVSSDGPDLGHDTTGVIANSVGSFQNWFAGKTGMIPCSDDFGSRLDILFFQLDSTETQIAAHGGAVVSVIYNMLVAAGKVDTGKKYVIYYQGTTTYMYPGTTQPVCGGAIVGGQAAAMYLEACPGIQFATSPTQPPWYWEFASLHDLMHTLGCVHPDAQNHNDQYYFHVDNPEDLMHSGDRPWNPKVVDTTGYNWFGDSVPVGVTNCKRHPIMITAPTGMAAKARARVEALGDRPQKVPFPKFREFLVEQK